MRPRDVIEGEAALRRRKRAQTIQERRSELSLAEQSIAPTGEHADDLALDREREADLELRKILEDHVE